MILYGKSNRSMLFNYSSTWDVLTVAWQIQRFHAHVLILVSASQDWSRCSAPGMMSKHVCIAQPVDNRAWTSRA